MSTPPVPARSAPLRLYLIRHGQTEWSLSGQHTGRTDIPLTAHGEEEARRLAAPLGAVTFDRVLCSPRIRARRTAELAGMNVPIETEPDLAEWDYGEFEGRRSVDIRKDWPAWEVFRDGCPGGESVADMTARVDRLIGKLSLLSGTVALFSHGHLGRSFVTRWAGLPLIEAQHFMLGTATYSILGFDPSHPDMRVISSWNVTPAP
ncbi:histidine phosphatase family protein [Ancylobacter sp. A5.8]|uniref:histidine phosphatase family protein n=1 Tax=Ancylobacter gelatini TaxID=2919920 RepID=UPI001F4E906A|nr:histidine phosphatase family protein [Ancylobacter gelatini]MCJ8143563.1 histidine phosphatase family protein [Ancylobacter gelatini]